MVPCSDTIARDAQLVVSELTTNTIVHTRSAPTVVASFDEAAGGSKSTTRIGRRHAPSTSPTPAVDGACVWSPPSPTGGDGSPRG
jgi:hypothetical protein